MKSSWRRSISNVLLASKLGRWWLELRKYIYRLTVQIIYLFNIGKQLVEKIVTLKRVVEV
jgi:hypothetical protein